MAAPRALGEGVDRPATAREHKSGEKGRVQSHYRE